MKLRMTGSSRRADKWASVSGIDGLTPLQPHPTEPNVAADFRFSDKTNTEALGDKIADSLPSFGNYLGFKLHTSLSRRLHHPRLCFRAPLPEYKRKVRQSRNRDAVWGCGESPRTRDGDDRRETKVDHRKVARILLAAKNTDFHLEGAERL